MVERILTLHPEGNAGVNIDRTRYDLIRQTIVSAIGHSPHSEVIPEQASITNIWQALDPASQRQDPALAKGGRNVGRQIAWFAFLHNSEKAQQLLAEWESAPPNPGASHWIEV